MSSDRARISYDETRRYRAVVAQQGRVTLEADTNEAWTIATEEDREETLDVVGAAGTPDDGYRVIPLAASTPPFDFQVGLGTMYVGGVRTVLPQAVTYSAQDEWLDRYGDPDWVSPLYPAGPTKARELIYLSLDEREVSATEDRVLREVALGGPDSSHRLRLVQRIKRFGTDATTCADALADVEAAWADQGLTFDPATMRLESAGRLTASFTPPPAPPDPCQPEAQGGYLGADNQLIRIQVTDWHPDTGVGRLVWGFDNASFLYRVDVVNPSLLRLQSRPPDDEHQPRSGQAVEVLRSAVKLDDAGEFVASATGKVMTLTSPYDPDTRQIVLPSSLPSEYTDKAKTPMVFLRVWEQEVAFKPGTPVTLEQPGRPTGVQVTLTTAGGQPFHVGDFWLVGVRPAAPTQAYPARHLAAPQPPDGPRRWACPLAVVQWRDFVMEVVEDCRNPFDNLVDLTRRRQGGCCDLVVSPQDLATTSLQTIVDRYAGKGQVTICLTPGVYALPEPLRLGPRHSHLTIEACHDGVVIEAAAGAEDHFFDGLVTLDHADNVTLRGLRFHLPQVRYGAGGPSLRSTALQVLAATTQTFNVTIGVHPVHCAVLTVEDCLFRYILDPNKDCWGAGILAQSECWGHRIRHNRFVRDDEYLHEPGGRRRVLYGYLLTSSLLPDTGGGSAAVMVPALLQDGSFEDNLFSGLIAAVTVIGLTGVTMIDDNTVRECMNGFIFLPDRLIRPSQALRHVRVPVPLAPAAARIADLIATKLLNPAVHIGSVLARIHPLPEEVTVAGVIPVDPAGAVRDDEELTALLTDLARTLTPAADVAGDSDTGAGTEPVPGIADVVERRTRQAIENAAPLGFSAGMYSSFAEAQAILSRFARAVRVPTERPLGLSMHVSGNEVQTAVDTIPTGFGLVVIADPAQGGDVTIVGGRFLGRAFGFLVDVLAVQQCAVSGNIVLNSDPEGGSLDVIPRPSNPATETVAVTGNVLGGRTILPPRPLPAPLNTWDVLNAKQ